MADNVRVELDELREVVVDEGGIHLRSMMGPLTEDRSIPYASVKMITIGWRTSVFVLGWSMTASFIFLGAAVWCFATQRPILGGSLFATMIVAADLPLVYSILRHRDLAIISGECLPIRIPVDQHPEAAKTILAILRKRLADRNVTWNTDFGQLLPPERAAN